LLPPKLGSFGVVKQAWGVLMERPPTIGETSDVVKE
jgi:hypothetical protein